MRVSDYFAELFVAGRFADAGWNVYFPHRDEGFDFVVTKNIYDSLIIRPVQVKGKYPSDEKGEQNVYGYIGKLTQLHPEMVLAIPYFSSQSPETPEFVAYMPVSMVRPHTRGFRCQPCSFRDGQPKKRREFASFFDGAGLRLLESQTWKDSQLGKAASV